MIMRKANKYMFILLASFIGGEADAQSSFKPGETWNDTGGSAINAHGGCVQYVDGTYYWFGETRSGSTSNGVSCYSSTDLYKWKKLTNAFTPYGTKTDDCKDVAQGRLFERPKVIYNAKTNKWIMWAHWENGSNYNEAKVAVLSADKIYGPYKATEDGVFRPNDCDSRDQTLFLANDGRAYHVSATQTNYKTHFIRLSEDFTKPTVDESLQVLGMRYEAASMFQYGDSYWCLFSGCDGWNPNRGRYAWYVGDDPVDDWKSGRDFYANNSWGVDFCVDEGNAKCYTSQPAYVFPVQGRDKCFIYMGDRWNSSNVGSSKYVWCPLSIRSGYPAVRWFKEWNLSFFDHLYDKKRLANLEDGQEFYLLERYSDRIVSRPSNGWKLQDDEESNVCFILHSTDEPYTWRIEQKSTGKYLTCTALGTLKLQDEMPGDEQQEWFFRIEEDGYYKLQGKASGKILSVSGNSTQVGTSIYMGDLSDVEDYPTHQSFALYFDSTVHPEYAEAEMYSKEYFAANKEAKQKQLDYIQTTGIDRIIGSRTSASSSTESIYTVQGIKVESITRPGIYIINGEKVICK